MPAQYTFFSRPDWWNKSLEWVRTDSSVIINGGESVEFVAELTIEWFGFVAIVSGTIWHKMALSFGFMSELCEIVFRWFEIVCTVTVMGLDDCDQTLRRHHSKASELKYTQVFDFHACTNSEVLNSNVIIKSKCTTALLIYFLKWVVQRGHDLIHFNLQASKER